MYSRGAQADAVEEALGAYLPPLTMGSLEWASTHRFYSDVIKLKTDMSLQQSSNVFRAIVVEQGIAAAV